MRGRPLSVKPSGQKNSVWVQALATVRDLPASGLQFEPDRSACSCCDTAVPWVPGRRCCELTQLHGIPARCRRQFAAALVWHLTEMPYRSSAEAGASSGPDCAVRDRSGRAVANRLCRMASLRDAARNSPLLL